MNDTLENIIILKEYILSNLKLKSKVALADYDKILMLKTELENDRDWQIIESHHIYGGRSQQDVDYITTYYNCILNKKVRFIVNYYTKCANARMIATKRIDDHFKMLKKVYKTRNK